MVIGSNRTAMDSSAELQPSPQLVLLRNGLRSALTNALNNQKAALLNEYGQGENEVEDKLGKSFEQFVEMVLQFGEEEISAWCLTHGLDGRFKNVADAREAAKYTERRVADPKAVDTRICVKRDEVQRLTDLIRKEETNSAHMRVTLARKEDAAKVAQGKI